jgi:subtilisin family serine protease
MRILIPLQLCALFIATASGQVDSAPCGYVPNEILVKLRASAAADIESSLKGNDTDGGLSLVRDLQQLNIQRRIRAIEPLFGDFERVQQRLGSLQSKPGDLLTKKEKHILKRRKRAPVDAEVPDLGRIYTIKLDPASEQPLEQVVAALRDNPDAEYAELNHVLFADFEPNDRLYPSQWALDKIDAPEAWDIATGNSQTIVAVIDTGVDYNHRDLANSMWVNESELNGADGVDDDDNGYVDDIYGYNFVYNNNDPLDDYGHGTHCAGIIAAEGNNGLDTIGVAWTGKIMAIKFLGSRGDGSTEDAALSVYYAVANGADVISMSWGSEMESDVLEDVLDYAHSQGLILVAAAGNSNSDEPQYPGAYRHVISVAATDRKDEKASSSNYGPWVDIAAPGESILSLRASGTSYGTSFDQYTTRVSGTSMAAPHVSGACALLLSANPFLRYSELYDILVRTTDPISPEVSTSGGRLNLFKAMHGVIPSRGYISIEHDYYASGSQVRVLLADWDVGGSGSQEVSLMTKRGDAEALVLSEATRVPGIFEAAIQTDTGEPHVQDGLVQVAHEEVIAAVYFDANDGGGYPTITMDSAITDYEPPAVVDGKVKTKGRTATIEVITDEPSAARIRCGPSCGGPYDISEEDAVITIYHKIKLPLLSLNTDYYFVVDLTDAAGNMATRDNDGQCYTFSTPQEFLGFRVPSVYPTIQAAIDDASDGDTIWVADGRYSGRGNHDIDFRGKAITVISENGPQNCIIDCRQEGRAFHFHSGEDEESVLDGFTITRGYPGRYGGGIRCTASSPTIMNCIVTDNTATDYGGGMYNCYNSNPRIVHCTFKRNSSQSQCILGNGGGISNAVNSDPTITDCTFVENSASFSGGGIHNCTNSSPVVSDCTFASNSATGLGGGMFSRSNSGATIRNCTFSWNWAEDGGGAMCNYYDSNPTISNCIFAGNSTDKNGGAIKNWDTSIVLQNCTVFGNTAGLQGGGIWNGLNARVDVANTILWENTDEDGTDESAQIANSEASKTATLNYCCVQRWTGALGGIGNMAATPHFVDAAGGDFHLASAGWRWDGKRERWHYDFVTSPCIDAGNPGAPLGDEPVTVPDDPNNDWGINLRLNMGAYGGTAEAGMPPLNGTILGDITNDGLVTAKDFAMQGRSWRAAGNRQPADLNRDGVVDAADVAVLAGDWLRYRAGASPTVTVIRPRHGASIEQSPDVPIEIEADAWDFDGFVVMVQFFADSIKVGQDDDGSDGWTISWTDFGAGLVSLTAKATDNNGITTTSLPVHISIIRPR